MQAVKNATTNTYKNAGLLDVNSDTSLKDAMNYYAGWSARSPAEMAAEFYKIGLIEVSTRLNSTMSEKLLL